MQRAFGSVAFDDATSAVQGPDGRWYVLEQAGRVMTFREGDARPSVFLDIRDRVTSGGETGLLGIALAPDFARSGVFFLDYTQGGPLRTHISSFTSNGTVADRASEAVLLEIAQPYSNHNGGQLAFGPDGHLYIGMGDGGSGGDPQGNAQNTSVLLGKILRIDVRDRTRYTIPADNPGFGRREIWAYGFRNPWRFSFEGGTLYVADVGQNRYEEIDVVGTGGNYGWNRMEGFHCYGTSTCDRTGLILPIAEYDHSEGCSVTGGYVYRGADPALDGIYFFGDYCSGRVWGLRYAAGRTAALQQVATTGFSVSTFARDNAGNVYVLQYGSSGAFYRILR